MSDDRELLELAARAAGIDPRRLPHAWPERFDDNQWDPLIDDGDALRLAVALHIHITISDYGKTVTRSGSEFRDIQEHGGDACAATRRAIVRAAADIAQRRG